MRNRFDWYVGGVGQLKLLKNSFQNYLQHLEAKFGQSFSSEKQLIKQHILHILSTAGSSRPEAQVIPNHTNTSGPADAKTRLSEGGQPNSPKVAAKQHRKDKQPQVKHLVSAGRMICDSEVVARAAVVQYGPSGGEANPSSKPDETVIASKVPATTLPLVLSKTIQRPSKSIMLVQADRHDEAIELSGDVGAVGRLTASHSGVILDLQGHRYAGSFIPCHSHLIVSLGKLSASVGASVHVLNQKFFSGANEAKVEHVCQEFVQLEHLENVIARMGGTNSESLHASGQNTYFHRVTFCQQGGRGQQNKPAACFQ